MYSKFQLEGEPLQKHLGGYNSDLRKFLNHVIWGCLNEYDISISREDLENGFFEYLRFSLDTALVIAKECQSGDTILLQDYQFIFVCGLLTSMFESVYFKDIFECIDQHKIKILQEKLDDFHSLCGTKNFNVSFFLHTSMPKVVFWKQLPDRFVQMIFLSLSEVNCGFHSPLWRTRFIASIDECEIGFNRELATVNPIGINEKEVRKKLTSKIGEHELAELNNKFRGKKMILVVGRIDRKNRIPELVEQVISSFKSDQSIWHRRTVVLQCPLDSSTAGRFDEYGRVKELVSLAKQIGIDIVWFEDNSRIRALALFKLADVLLIGSQLGGFEVIALEALFINPQIITCCTKTIGSAAFVRRRAFYFDEYDEIGLALSRDYLFEPRNLDSLSETELFDLVKNLNPNLWIQHQFVKCNSIESKSVTARESYLEAQFGQLEVQNEGVV